MDYFVNKSVPLTALSPWAETQLQNCLSWWENTANIRFVKDDLNPLIRIFEFTQVKSNEETLGFSHEGTNHLRGRAGVGFNTEFMKSFGPTANNQEMFDTFYHEIGHTLSLAHPFHHNFSVTHPDAQTTSHTVMAYDAEFDPTLNKKLTAITPMPADIDAMHFLYGKNTRARRGNDDYHVSFFTEKEPGTIASLPWDAAGIDTLSAENVDGPVTLDIRRYGRSATSKGYIMTPNIELENVIGGKGRNTIFLNELNNNVDVSDSAFTKLIIDPKNCGHDTVKGFNPARDKITLLAMPGQTATWKLIATTIKDTHGNPVNSTVIQFSKINTVTLLGVNKEQIQPETITHNATLAADAKKLTARQADADKALWAELGLLPAQLVTDFSNAFLRGTALTFIDTLTDETLFYYGVQEDLRDFVLALLHCFYIILSGTILTNAAGFVIAEAMRVFGINDATCNKVGAACVTLLNIAQDLSPVGLARTTASLVGSYAGSYLTFWARKKIIGKPHEQEPEQDLENQSDAEDTLSP